MKNNFMSSRDNDEKCLMHSKNVSSEIVIIQIKLFKNELLQSLLHKYQVGLKELMKGGNFAFYSVDELLYKCNEISLICCGSNINSFVKVRSKNTTINPKKFDDKCLL